MGSRLRECPDKLFEVFLEVAKPDGQHEEPFIVQKYPTDFNDQETLKPVPKFAFPCDTERYTTTVDHFTFVLTDVDSKLKFGYCRHATGAQTCFCIVSCLPWFEVFYNLLNTLAEIQNHHEDPDLTGFLRAAYTHEVPAPGIPVTIVSGQVMMNFTAPDTSKLPSIPTNRNLTEYYNAIDTEKMMQIFASMLHERRIIITSKKLSRLTACVHASADLLYPMYWQHLFIPVLPTFLKDYLSAPMPYLIGVHTTILESMRDLELDDAVIVDVDKNKVETTYDDFEDLPSEVASYLKRHLKSEKVRMMMQSKGDAIPRAFLMAMVKLIGGYRDALKFQSGELITFCPDTFVQSRPESMRPFLEKILHLQIFQQFINGRLDMLNTGIGFSDIFEQLSMSSADKLNAQSRYKEWLNNMKKQGKKFQRGGKDIWSDFKGMASPAMAYAVENMKDKGRKAYSGLKHRIADMKRDDGEKNHRNSPRGLTNRPQTINISQDIKSTRPPRPTPPSPSTQSLRVGVHDKPGSRVTKLEERTSVDDSEAGLSYNRVSINLLADPDIQNALNKSSSTGQLPVQEAEEALLVFDSSSDTSSGRGSPTFNKLVEFDSNDTGSTTGSTSTQDSFGHVPFIDSAVDTTASSVGSESDSQHPRPVPPPRRNRAAKLQNKVPVSDKLIKPTGKPPPPPSALKPKLKPKPRLSSTDEGVVKSESTSPGKEVKKEQTVNTLIRIDSVDDEYDPFASANTSTVSQLDVLEGLRHVSDTDSSVASALSRKHAFKKTSIDMPLRQAKPDVSLESSPERELGENNKTNDLLSDFDPLSEVKLRQTRSVDSDRQRPVTELLHNWELKKLTSQNAPSGAWNPKLGMSPGVGGGVDHPHPPHHRPLTRLVNQLPGANPYRPTVMSTQFPQPMVTTKLTTPQAQDTSGQQNRNSGDPFEDLLNLSLTTPPSQPTWEKFE